MFGKRRHRFGRRDLRLVGLRQGPQGAELVAAHPVRAPAPGQQLAEPRAESLQQLVAGQVPERVVVVLEAIEIEEREHQRPLRIEFVEMRGQVGRQLAAVAQAGQSVRRRLTATLRQHPSVVLHRQIEADER